MTPADDDRAYLAKFGARLRQLRLERRLSQEALADRAGMHRTFIGQLERGEHGLNIASLHRLAAAFGLHGRDLLP